MSRERSQKRFIPWTTTAWVVLFGHYVQGVYTTSRDAEDYTERRWGKYPPTTWKIEPYVLGSGAFDPKDDE